MSRGLCWICGGNIVLGTDGNGALAGWCPVCGPTLKVLQAQADEAVTLRKKLDLLKVQLLGRRARPRRELERKVAETLEVRCAFPDCNNTFSIRPGTSGRNRKMCAFHQTAAARKRIQRMRKRMRAAGNT